MASNTTDVIQRSGRSRVELHDVFAGVCVDLRLLPASDSFGLVRQLKAELVAVEAQLVADQIAGGVPPRMIERSVGSGSTCTNREAGQIRRRGELLGSNPDLAEAVSSGALAVASLDALAAIDGPTDGAAAQDAGLIDQLTAGGPQQAGRITRDWVHERETDGQLERRRQRQLRLRSVDRYTDHSTGLDVLSAKGDHHTIDMIWRRLRRDADRAYEADGGRDVPDRKHRRTRDQRMFDCFAEAITGSAPIPEASDVATGPFTEADRSAYPGQDSGRNAKRAPTQLGACSKVESSAAGHGRCRGGCSRKPLWIVTQTIDGDGTLGLPNLAGTGPLPASISDRLSCASDIAGLVFGRNGHPLWISTSERLASPALWRALVARDRGCVLSGAPPELCEAHHMNPWTSRLGGQTHIDTMALLAKHVHKWLHDNQLTLVRNTDGTWKTRPATPDELPAQPGFRSNCGPRRRE